MVPSTDRSHSLEFRVIKNVPFCGYFSPHYLELEFSRMFPSMDPSVGVIKAIGRPLCCTMGGKSPPHKERAHPRDHYKMFPYVDFLSLFEIRFSSL